MTPDYCPVCSGELTVVGLGADATLRCTSCGFEVPPNEPQPKKPAATAKAAKAPAIVDSGRPRKDYAPIEVEDNRFVWRLMKSNPIVRRIRNMLFKGRIVKVEKGRVVRRSWMKTVFKLVYAICVLVVGGVCLLFGLWALWRVMSALLIDGNAHGSAAFVIAVAGLFTLLGGLGVFVGAAIALYYSVRLFYPERYVIGRKYLQCIIGQAKAQAQLPFKNIAKICPDTKLRWAGRYRYYEKFIGINLNDAGREDTFVYNQQVDENQRVYGYDYVIKDEFEIHLTLFDSYLEENWQRARKGYADGGIDEDSLASHWYKSQHIVIYSIIFVFLFFSCCLPLPFALWFEIINKKSLFARSPQRQVMSKPAANAAPSKAPKPAAPAAPPTPVTGDVALDKILSDLESQNVFERSRAAESLAAMQPNQHRAVVAQKIAKAVNAPDAANRSALIRALGAWATPNEVPVLIQQLDDDNPFLRVDVLKVLGKLHDERALAPIVRCYKDGIARREAANALRDMGPMAEMSVIPLLDAEDILFRVDVINLLKDIGTTKSVPRLQMIAANKGPFAPQAARDALAAIAARNK